MGLRERALRFQKDFPDSESLALSVDENNSASPELNRLNLEEWDAKAIEQLKERGKASRHELLQKLPEKSTNDLKDNFLLRDEARTLTQPVNNGSALHNRIEALLNLIELCKEIGIADNEDDLWSTVLYGLLGQVGAKEAAIFLKTNDHLKLKTDRGFIIDPNFSLPKRSGLERVLTKDKSIHYVNEVISLVAGEDKTWLQSLPAEIIIPILKYEEFCGFIILGKPIGVADYHIDDLLFLKLFGEVLGSMYESIQRIVYISEQQKLWQHRDARHNHYVNFINQLHFSKTSNEASDIIENTLKKEYGVKMYLYLEKENEALHPKLSSGLKQESIDNFIVPFSEPWAWESRHHKSWYNFVDFKKDEKLSQKFSSEDLSVIESMFVLPIFFQNELNAIFLIFEIDRNLIQEDLKYLQTILQYYHMIRISQDMTDFNKKQIEGGRQDPLFALKKLIDEHESKLINRSLPYSVISILVTNYNRIKEVFGVERTQKLSGEIKHLLTEELTKQDFLAEIFPGQFLLMLTGYSQGDSWSLVKLLQKKLSRLYPDKDTSPILRTRYMTRPDQELKDLSEILF